ncbi:hypothetical protein PIB30_008703 [Stylosanthes scabra]|uniref:Uncharacterized protein n=1 Tax=Stylosanthes scabra TaxID=79078 RepID=A0ABU6U6R1_9FABA|nr:hypothetical protein [Stylosanthes scabra]
MSSYSRIFQLQLRPIHLYTPLTSSRLCIKGRVEFSSNPNPTRTQPASIQPDRGLRPVSRNVRGSGSDKRAMTTRCKGKGWAVTVRFRRLLQCLGLEKERENRVEPIVVKTVSNRPVEPLASSNSSDLSTSPQRLHHPAAAAPAVVVPPPPASSPCLRHRARAALPRRRPFCRSVSFVSHTPAAARAIYSYRHRSSPAAACLPGVASLTPLPLVSVMGKMNKNKKVGGRPGPPANDMQNQEMDIRKIMKEVENFSYSHMTWKERKKIENQKVVSLGGKPPKKQKLPLSVARPTLKKQKEREQKMLQERLILGQFGGKHSGSSKKPAGKHKAEDRGLRSSEGHFRNGILDVRHLLKSAPSTSRDHDTMSSKGFKKGGKGKQGKKGGGKKHH